MTPMFEPHQFAPIWLDMLQAWPATREVAGTSSAYARRLAMFTLAEVRAAVESLILECDFMPSIGTIWKRCIDARDQTPGWEEAWLEAQQHASSSTVFPWSHEAVREAARAIGGLGLHEIRESTNPAATRAQYRDAYQSIVQRRRRQFVTRERELPPPARRALEPTKGA